MVTAKAPLSFYDLVQRMKGKRTIGNWDILVTYDEESLNERLAEEADRNKLLDDVAVDTTIPRFFPHGEVPAHVTLKLASPAVSFGPGEDEAHLRLNVGGQYMVEGDEIPTRFPEGYRIDIRASLAAATGHFDDNHFKKAETEQQAGAGVVLRVPDDPGLLCGVYLDLGKGSAHWTLIDQDGKPAKGSTAEDVRGFVVTAVEAFLDQQSARWFIGGIQATEVNDDGSRLVPETFRFTILPADPAVPESKGAFCMWIKVKHSYGQSNGANGFDNFETHPIPQGRSASVVFSHDLLPWLESFTKGWMGSIRTAGSDPAHVQEDGDADATYAGMRLKAPVTFEPENDLRVFDRSELGGDLDINMGPDIAVDGTPALVLVWDSKVHEQRRRVVGGFTPDYDIVRESQCQTRGSGSWIGQGKELGMVFNISRVVNVHEYPPSWPDPPPVLVTLSSDNKSIQYLLATNLLFPNRYIFNADSVPAPRGASQRDIHGGLACPHDLILTGNLMKHSVA